MNGSVDCMVESYMPSSSTGCSASSDHNADENSAVLEHGVSHNQDVNTENYPRDNRHQLPVLNDEASAESDCSTCTANIPSICLNDTTSSSHQDVNCNSSGFANENSNTLNENNMAPEMLRDELARVKTQLRFKEEECVKLAKMQDQTGLELQDLTASLFEEANKMVQDAHIQRMATEKKLDEANARIEILQAEVIALKALVITSTPSAPNPHLNPQIDRAKKTDVFKGHRRSTSHHNFNRDWIGMKSAVDHSSAESLPTSCVKSNQQVEPFYMDLFLRWKREPVISPENSFIECVVVEDIQPCLRFANESLSKLVFDGVFNNTLTVEPLLSCTNLSHTHCSLTEAIHPCQYCVKLDGSQSPFSICLTARNRIIAVCDLLTYLRYIAQGLVKCDELGMYNEVTRLRKNICLARLGLTE